MTPLTNSPPPSDRNLSGAPKLPIKLSRALAASKADLFATAVSEVHREKLSTITIQYLLPLASGFGNLSTSIDNSANGEPEIVRLSTTQRDFRLRIFWQVGQPLKKLSTSASI